ncbi:MAG: hypothetical protein JRC89_08975 [Deltaproteobacteria bacterium]|nr:hypothetical protein [Deltaproteobacteria bacterium]
MNVLKAARIWLGYHKAHSKKNTVRAYESILFKFCQEFDNRRLNELSTDDILSFLNRITVGKNPAPKESDTLTCQPFLISLKTTLFPIW